MAISRRTLFGAGLGLVGYGASGGAAAAAEMVLPRTLSILNLHTGETLKATYWEAGAYVSDALAAVNKVLRDFRTGDSHPIDPKLLDRLTLLTRKLDAKGPVQIISGYRSPKSNAALSARSGEVATHSLHMDGKAVDIRLPGIDLARLHKAALTTGEGGVGYYPVSNFVHLDVGRTRRWQGS